LGVEPVLGPVGFTELAEGLGGLAFGAGFHGLAAVVQVSCRCPLAWLDDLKARQFTIANCAICDNLAAELDPKSKRPCFDRAREVASDPAFGVLVVVVSEIAPGNFVAHESPNGLDSLPGHSFALCVVHRIVSRKV
jgi:hypothetical protein